MPEYSEETIIELLQTVEINKVGLSRSIVDILERNGKHTLLDLCNTSLREIRTKTTGLGLVRQRELFEMMDKFGLKFDASNEGIMFLPYLSKGYIKTDYSKVNVEEIIKTITGI